MSLCLKKTHLCSQSSIFQTQRAPKRCLKAFSCDCCALGVVPESFVLDFSTLGKRIFDLERAKEWFSYLSTEKEWIEKVSKQQWMQIGQIELL